MRGLAGRGSGLADAGSEREEFGGDPCADAVQGAGVRR